MRTGVASSATYRSLTAVAPLVLTAVVYTLQHSSHEHLSQALLTREAEAQCPVQLRSPNACHQVRQQCPDFDNDGLIPYLRLYACAPLVARPVVLVVMLVWLLVLFASMATAAADFLAVHLAFLVKTLGIDEHVAGVTVFAFGNGCTDLFSTLAAMGSNSGSLAISELFGAGAFITTVVLGVITLIQPFDVDPTSFVGDVVWFMIAAALLVAFLADGQLVLGECLGIIGLYIAFVVFAVFRRKDRVPAGALRPSHGSHEDDMESDGSEHELRNDLPPLPSTSDPGNSSVIQNLDLADESPPPDSPLMQGQHSWSSPEEHLLPNAEELEELTPPPHAQTGSDDHEPELLRRQYRSLLMHFPSLESWRQQSAPERLLTVLSMPLLLPIVLTTPSGLDAPSEPNDLTPGNGPGESSHSSRRFPAAWLQSARSVLDRACHWKFPSRQTYAQEWFLCLQLLLGPQFFNLAIASQFTTSTYNLLLRALVALLTSALLVTFILPMYNTHPSSASPRGSGILLSSLGFLISLTWIFLTATSAVSLLLTLSLVLQIPPALLGATVFAIGQSSNDLVANTAVAKRGMPVLAASASFGGPMMNLLLGIGGGGLVQVLKARRDGSGGAYAFQPAMGMFVSAACLIVGLGITLGYAFWRSWRLGPGLGWTLIAIWVAFTVVNVGLSIGL